MSCHTLQDLLRIAHTSTIVSTTSTQKMLTKVINFKLVHVFQLKFYSKILWQKTHKHKIG